MGKARCWSSDMPMTPSWDSSIRRMQITSWKTYGMGWGSLGWNSVPTRRAGLSSVGLPDKTGNEEGKADRKRSTFWASRTSAGRTGSGDSQCEHDDPQAHASEAATDQAGAPQAHARS